MKVRASMNVPLCLTAGRGAPERTSGRRYASSAALPAADPAVFPARAVRRRFSAQAARMSSEKSSTTRIAQTSSGPMTCGASGSVMFSPPAAPPAAGR